MSRHLRPVAFLVVTAVVFGIYVKRSPGGPLLRSAAPRADAAVGTTLAAKAVDPASLEALESYQLCVDAIMTNKSSMGCVKKREIPDRMLYLTIGDSTARQHAKAVNNAFPNFKFNGTRVDLPASVTGDFEVGGKNVSVVLAMFSGLRHFNVQQKLVQDIRNQVAEHGMQPSVIVFSGLGLHECVNARTNRDPFWAAVKEARTANVSLTRWRIEALSLADNHRLQEPCTLSVLKQLRLEYPETTFLWRPMPSPVELFTGSVHDKIYEKKCRKGDKWRRLASSCGVTHMWHMQLRPKLREIGVGFLDYSAVYPEHCALMDTVHLTRECHNHMTKRVFESSLLEMPRPELYLDKDAVATEQMISCPLARKVKKLKDDVKLVSPEEIAALQITDRKWLNVRCADLLDEEAYDPLTGDFFRPTEEDVEAGRRVSKVIKAE